MSKPKTTTRKLTDYTLDTNNINEGSEFGSALLEKSLREVGAGRSMLADKNGVMIAGNKTLEKAGELGFTDIIEVETTGTQLVVVKRMDLDITTPQGIKAKILDNTVSKHNYVENAEVAQAMAVAADIELGAYGLKLTNMTAKDDEFEIPDTIETDIKKGDLFRIGDHRLICGDARKPADIIKLLQGEQIDLHVIDPPYNVDYEGKAAGVASKIMNDNMTDAKFYEFLLSSFRALYTFTKPGAAIYVWHADSEGLNFRRAFTDAGFLLKQCLVWVKSSITLGRQDYQWRHEPCQPAGTMVRTPDGNRPIEQLKTGDTVLSFDKYAGQVKGYRDGLKIKTAKRKYTGTLYGIECGGKTTWATDNHKFTVRFRDCKREYCTYLMRRGPWWRVGITGTYNARGFGLKHRMRQENCDEAWIIATHETKGEAQCAEQVLTIKYGIPFTHWEQERGFKNQPYKIRSNDQIAWIYSQLDLKKMQNDAHRLLHDYGRSPQFPLITKGNQKEKFSCRVTAQVQACNLIPDLMDLPIPYEKWDTENDRTFEWQTIDRLATKQHDGPVYSLEVEKFEHYIADGIVTHNCIYGWKPGTHYFTEDRSISTVIEDQMDFSKLTKAELVDLLETLNSDAINQTVLYADKPSKNNLHPTMKPVTLIARQIQNSSQPGAIVADAFGGSGTTMICCEQLGRHCRMMELDPKFCQVTIERMIAYDPYLEITRNGKPWKPKPQTATTA